MKVIFAEVRSKSAVKVQKDELEKLPKTVGLLTTVQFIGQLDSIKKQVEDSGRKVLIGRGIRTKYEGQVLGCDSSAAREDADGFLYVGTGIFHPLGIALRTEKPVFILDPSSGKIEELRREKVEKVKKRRKGALLKLLNSERIGILVSLKPGQEMLGEALRIKNLLESRGKSAYIFIFDTLDFSELENFPFVKCFLNLACPRISEDFERFSRPVADYSDAKEFLK